MLEPRLLLSAPAFVTPLADRTFTSGGALTVAIDGRDDDGDVLTITAVSDNPGLVPYIPRGNRFARLSFVETDLVTPIGDILIELFEDRSPTSTGRFVTLSQNAISANGTLDPNGTPFWTDVVVHRVIPGFVIQTGDRESGNGTGGSPLGDFEAETHEALTFAGAGAVAWANSGGPTNDSQFYITAAETNHLDGLHPIIGQMISGQAVLDNIINRARDASNRPLAPPRLHSVQIVASGQDATITLLPVNGFGGTAHVTVALDDGTTVTRDTFTVTVLGIDDPGEQTVPAGATRSLTATVRGQGNTTATLAAAADLATAAVSVNSATRQVGLTTPAGYSGFYRVDLTATQAAPAPTSGLSPAQQSFAVFAQQPGDPAALGWLPTSKRVVGSNAGSNLLGRAFASTWHGDRLYIANGEGGIEIWDVADATRPAKLGSFDTIGQVRDIAVVGDTAFVAATFGGLLSLDVSDPADIRLLDQLASTSATVSLAVHGDVLYTAEFALGMRAVNISNPADLRLLGTLADLAPAANMVGLGITLGDGVAFVTDQLRRVVAVDIADPRNMRHLAIVSTGGQPFGIAYEDHRLYVADQEQAGGGLLIYDATDPARLRQLGRVPLVGGAFQVDVAGAMAVVAGAGADATFSFIDATDPAHASVAYAFRAPSVATRPEIHGQQVALSAFSSGVALLAMPNRAPTMASPVADFEINAGSAARIIDLTTVFADADLPLGDRLVYAVTANTDPGAVGAAIVNGRELELSFARFGSGVATIALRATDSIGASVLDTFTVTVAPANQLGRFDASARLTLAIGGADATFSLKGAGLARVLDAGAGAADLHITGTGPGSAITITTRGGDLRVRNVQIDGPLASFSAKTSDLVGDFTSGPAGSILFDDVEGPSVLSLGAALSTRDAVALAFDRVSDLVVEALMPIRSLTVTQWEDTDTTPDIVRGPTLGSLVAMGAKGGAAPGHFQAGLDLGGAVGAMLTLGSAKIAGDLAAGLAGNPLRWEIHGDAGAIDASKGAVDGWQLAMHSAVKTLKLGRVVSADLTVGDADGSGRRGDIGTLSATQWDAGRILAGSIKSLAMKADPRTTGGNGAMRADLVLTGSADQAVKLTLGGAKLGAALDGGAWQVDGPTGKITAGSIATAWSALFQGDVAGLAVKGDTGGQISARSLKSMSVGGEYRNARLTLTRAVDPGLLALGTLAVKGRMQAVEVRSSGNVGKVDAGLMLDSHIFAGVAAVVLGLPDDDADFVADAAIGQISVKGIAGEGQWLIRSSIAASSLGRLALGRVLTRNEVDGATFGVAARAIGSIAYEALGTRVIASDPAAIAGLADVDQLAFRLL